MMHEEVAKYRELSGDTNPNTPISRIGGYLDGYEKALEQKPKAGHWIYKIYGGYHEQGDWLCSHCNHQFNYGKGQAEYCPKCGYEMSEAPTEEVMNEYDK